MQKSKSDPNKKMTEINKIHELIENSTNQKTSEEKTVIVIKVKLPPKWHNFGELI